MVGVTCDDVQWTGRVAFQVVFSLKDILQVDISSECSDNIEGSCGEEPTCTHRCHTRDDSVASIVQYCRCLSKLIVCVRTHFHGQILYVIFYQHYFGRVFFMV